MFGHKVLAELGIAVPSRGVDRMAAHRAGTQAGDADRSPARMGESGMDLGDLVEGRPDPVPRNGLEVLDQASARVVGQPIQAHLADPELEEQLDTFGAGPEVQHREQDRAPSHRPDGLLAGAPDDHDDVLARAFLIRTDPGPSGPLQVGGLIQSEADAVSVLDDDLAKPNAVQEGDEPGKEVTALPRLFVHARQTNRQTHATVTLGERAGGPPGPKGPRPEGQPASIWRRTICRIPP
jgi:hypothetical protein